MFMLKLKKISFILTILILLQPCRLLAQTYNADGTASGGGANAGGGINEEIEPSDDYRPDGYYEPYDFSFVKTNQNKTTNSGGPSPVVENSPSSPVYDSTNQINNSNTANTPDTGAKPEYQPPAYPPNEQINVPQPPDFNETAVTALVLNGKTGVTTSITPGALDNNSSNQPPVTGNNSLPANAAANSAAGTQGADPAVTNAGAAAQAGAAELNTLKLLVRAQRPLRYQLTNDKLTNVLDKVIGNENVEDDSWNLIS